MNSDNRPHEIIIIKRGGEEEEGHHGGAWKIAFADFMTAMMALFLVLWLVNAANEETKKAVASYFNPVKLVDRNQSRKGLDEQKGGPVEGPESAAAPAAKPETKSETPADEPGEEAFFRDPFTALADIAAKETESLEAQRGQRGENTGALPEIADPFSNPLPPKTHDLAPAVVLPAEPEKTKTETPKNEADARKDKIEELSKSILSEIKAELGAALGMSGEMNAAVSVVPVNEGVLISVTDQLNYPMFEIGSAVPRGPVVLAMEKISMVLAKRPGPIRIYGHTDGRPYRSISENNWHLSSARALSAHYMLVRAGLDEKRVAQITGFADRKLKSASDPNADLNRRIELLLEVQ